MSVFFESEPSSESGDFQTIKIDLLTDFLQDLEAEFSEYNWSDEDGILHVLGAGLAALQNARQPRLISPEESLIIDQLQAERIRMYGRYAAMKHQVAQLQRDIKLLEVQLKANQSLWNALRKRSLVVERSE
jgi:hypothetical protein